MGEWRETTLGEVCEMNISSISKNYSFQDILYLDTGSVTKGKIESLKKIKLIDAPSRAKRLVKKNSIVYSTVRPNQEHYGFINNPQENLVVSTGFAVIDTIDKSADAKFLYYFLSQSRITQTLHQIAEHTTSTYPSIKPEHIKILNINLPPLQEQKAIANILSSFDDKIELLKEQNETLEQMAQGVFREWFVDGVDESWEVKTLGEVTNIKGGATPSTKNEDFWNGDIHWTSPKDLSNSKSVFLLDTNKKITEAGLKKISSGLLPRGTLLLSSRAPIGYLAISNVDIAINQGYIALLDDAYFSNYYMYFWLKTHMRLVEGASNGSTFQEISKSAFRQIKCIVPKKENIEEFDGFVTPIFDKLLLNIEEINTLEKTRDTLLPKLMSGELRVIL